MIRSADMQRDPKPTTIDLERRGMAVLVARLLVGRALIARQHRFEMVVLSGERRAPEAEQKNRKQSHPNTLHLKSSHEAG